MLNACFAPINHVVCLCWADASLRRWARQADPEKRIITMDRLVAAAQDEVDKDSEGKRPAGMYM
jgi:hypothetical protein